MGLYLFLDAARMGRALEEVLTRVTVCDSLYEGGDKTALMEVAPYLADVGENGRMLTWYAEKGWGNSWGYFIRSGASMSACVAHFRKFLVDRTNSGEERYFRFYDPRVLKAVLPTYDERQVIDFFGPVEHFLTEGSERSEGLKFGQRNGVLLRALLPVGQVFGKEIKIT
jgi:hypothetical protein